ncbi:hypothetical protein FOZ60_006987 [Perkinsus olseni]|uniref:Uncharacterized protein n=1 Tax=Perkinsus olseni TaxID=32597 RepID=A0A7J6NME0_PEROL|nr:hypothetical protein FOZ60_006987 [Perkinsus olseni]
MLRPEEVEALGAKLFGEDLGKRLQLRFLFQSVLTEVAAAVPVQVDIPHVTSRLDYARFYRPFPTPGIGGQRKDECGSSIHGLCLEQGAGADDSINIKSEGMIFTLNGSEATVDSPSVDDDLINVEASRASQEGRIQVVSVAEKLMSSSSSVHVCETGCVTALPSTAVPTVTVKVSGNIVGQGLDQDPSDATRNSEDVPAISDMICGKRHCMVDVGFRQKPSCSPWSAKTAALPDAGGQGTVSINADLCRAAKCERVFNDSLSWFFASSTENADEESVKVVQFKVIEGLTPNVTIDGETVKGRSLYRSMLLDSLSSIADDGKDRAGVEANNDIVTVQPGGFAVTTSTVLIGRDHSVDCVMMFSLVPYFEHPRGWYSLCVLNEVAVVDEGLRREDGSLANTVHNVTVYNVKRRLRLTLDRRKLKDVFCSSRDDIPGVGADPITVCKVEGLVERVFLVSVNLVGLYESQFGRLEVLATVNVNAACADFQRLSDIKPKEECLCSSHYEWFFWKLLAKVRVLQAGMSCDHILHVLCMRGMYGYITIKQPVSLCDLLGIVLVTGSSGIGMYWCGDVDYHENV